MLTLILWRFLLYNKEKKEQNSNLKKIKNQEILKENNKKIWFVVLVVVVISIIIGVCFYNNNPVDELESRNSICYLTNYTYNSFLIFDNSINNSTLTTFISFFPMVLFIGILYIFKEETEHLNFIVPCVLVSILELIIVGANINLVIIPNYIFVLGFNLLQIFMIIYIFARVEKRLFNLSQSAYITLIGLILLMFMPIVNVKNKMILDISYIVFVMETYIILNYSDKRFWRLASWVFTVICFFDFFGYLIVNFV